MFWMILWMILMVVWLVFEGGGWDRTNPRAIGGSIIPWACVLILGLWLFGAIGGPNVVVFH